MLTDINRQSDRCVVRILDGSLGTRDAALRLDLGMRQPWLAESQQVPLRMHVASKRANRRAWFSLRETPRGRAARTCNRIDRRIRRGILPETIRIGFKCLELGGMSNVVNILYIDPADPSLMRRLPGKYARKNFCLYHVHVCVCE